MNTVLITGADRGLGSALTEGFLREGFTVFAGQFMPEWHELANLQKQYPDTLRLIPLDVSDLASIRRAYELVSRETDCLDILVNNAGISGGAGDIYALENVEQGLGFFRTNTLGQLKMVNEFLPLMERGLKRLCFVSSEAGAISVCHRRDGFLYPMTKAALNSTVKLLFAELYPRGYTFRLYNPGWMKSYIHGSKWLEARIEPEESAAVAVPYFIRPLEHEDVLKLTDNDRLVWPF